jgi:hypothetical protein
MVGVGCPSVSAPFTVGPGLRMLFDWLVVGQVVPTNPTAVVRGPKHVVKTGKTPVLEGSEWRKLLKSIPTTTLRDLRDRALIATLTYSFARITAALKMKVEDLRPRGALTAGTSWIEPSIPRETTKVSSEALVSALLCRFRTPSAILANVRSS